MKILLYRGRGLFGRMISWQTRSPFSHAAILFPEDQRLIEAREGEGVTQRIWFTSGAMALDLAVEGAVPFDVPGVNDERAMKFARAQLGKGYDWSSVFRFVSRRQAAREASAKWFCSELAYATAQVGGVNLLRAVEPWEVSPGLLSRSPLLRPTSFTA